MAKNTTKNIMIVGVGRQGTLLTSRILGGITFDARYVLLFVMEKKWQNQS